MKKYIIFLILSLFSLVFPNPVSAEEKINKFGIHILEPADLVKAEELVNSSGGDWGWVTVVIRDDDLNFDKWQDFMDECRERHLVPLIRIATHLEGSVWSKPKPEDGQKWANFLANLNWPTSDQYVIIFNEPNHAKEWGKEISPKEYAHILLGFSSKLKVQSLKFRILNAGLDLAAPNSKTTMDALRFMKEMNNEIPGIFEKLDGWVSHSYPNHGFVGKPWESGRTSIRGYEWELSVLKNYFGVLKDLDIFITETGWPKSSAKCNPSTSLRARVQSARLRQGQNSFCFYDEETVANYIKYSFENVWMKDDKVKAVTPFLLNYPGELFAEFSWLDKEGSPYLRYEIIKNIPKLNWWPNQETKYEVKSIGLPPFLPVNTEYKGKIILKNVGQSIWGEQGPKLIQATSSGKLAISNLIFPSVPKIRPGESLNLEFSLTSGDISGEEIFTWEGIPEQKVKIFPASLLVKTKYNFWQKFLSFIPIFLKIDKIQILLNKLTGDIIFKS